MKCTPCFFSRYRALANAKFTQQTTAKLPEAGSWRPVPLEGSFGCYWLCVNSTFGLFVFIYDAVFPGTSCNIDKADKQRHFVVCIQAVPD